MELHPTKVITFLERSLREDHKDFMIIFNFSSSYWKEHKEDRYVISLHSSNATNMVICVTNQTQEKVIADFQAAYSKLLSSLPSERTPPTCEADK